MEEKKNITTAAAAEETINSIKKLIDAIGNDDELKEKLEETLAALTGKGAEPEETKTSDTVSADEKKSVDADDADDADEEDEEDEEVPACPPSCTTLSDVFNEDAIAGMVVGFVAGAAVVGGGVLLHKMLK